MRRKSPRAVAATKFARNNGPIVGMLGYIGALKFAPAGLVSTVVSASPLVILPVVAVKYGVRVRPAVVAALVVAVVGVGMIMWKPE